MTDWLQITVEPYAVSVYAFLTQNDNKKQQNLIMLIDLNGVYVDTDLVAVVRASSLDDDQTVIFTAGQSATDSGHLIDMPVEAVVEMLNTISRQRFAEELMDEIDAGADSGIGAETSGG